MNKRHLAIGVALAALLAAWLWRNGGETPAPKDSAQRAEVPAAPRTQAPQWSPAPPATPPAPGSYGLGYPGFAGPYGQAPTAAYPPQEGYRFRPLGERERRRIEEQARSPYGPAYPYPSARDSWPSQRAPGTGAPPTYGVDPSPWDPWMPDGGGRGWGTEAYGQRSPEPARRGGDRWQGPYTSPAQPGDWLPADPGLLQEPNQWGAVPPERTPPAYRMYPALETHRDRKLAVR